MPRISVVVPIYNVEQYLRRCLDSILGQTYRDFEVICVDDCSPDHSWKILEEYEEKYSQVKVLTYEENRGLGGARDFGLSHAQGEYVVFIDSDDYIDRRYLEVYENAMDEHTDIVLGGYFRVENEKIHEIKVKNSADSPWIYPSVWLRMYRKSFLDENGLDFRGIRSYEDGPFNIRCMLKNPGIKVIDYSGYFYVYNPMSITQNRDGKKMYEVYVKNYLGLKEDINEGKRKLTEYNRQMLEYTLVQGLTIAMVANIRRLPREDKRRLYRMRKKALRSLYPDYLHCKKVGWNKIPDEYAKIKAVLNIYIKAEKCRLDTLIVWFI